MRVWSTEKANYIHAGTIHELYIARMTDLSPCANYMTTRDRACFLSIAKTKSYGVEEPAHMYFYQKARPFLK